MSKKRFVQDFIIRAKPTADALIQAIAEAERIWAGLNSAGYGADKAATPRESVDYYAKLDERQTAFFDQFWEAFCLKKDRNGAAMRWGQLGKLDDVAYRKIIAAAERQAKVALPPGQVRKMAEGWLFERRYEDGGQTRSHAKAVVSTELARLNNELLQLQKLYEASKDPALAVQIDKLRAKMGAAMAKAAGGPPQ